MSLQDLIEHQYIRMDIPELGEYIVAEKIISKYLSKCPNAATLDINWNDYIERMLSFYFYGGEKDKKMLEKLFEKSNFNYRRSIHNAMYYLLLRKDDLGECISPYLWPGIYDIKKDNSKYELKTKVGNITFYKASKVFQDTSSSYIFSKSLSGECHARSYDFLKENKDYQVVLSYASNFFVSGHYHTYLEKGDTVLDIACNAFYDNRKDADKILGGEIIKKLSYEEVEYECKKLSKQIGKIKDCDKLNVLTLYYDRMKHKI